jgi:hypothetical protein
MFLPAIITLMLIGTVVSVWIGGFTLVDRWVESHPSPLRDARLGESLERWHDAYDVAILDGKDEAEAVWAADEPARVEKKIEEILGRLDDTLS